MLWAVRVAVAASEGMACWAAAARSQPKAEVGAAVAEEMEVGKAPVEAGGMMVEVEKTLRLVQEAVAGEEMLVDVVALGVVQTAGVERQEGAG